jgi:hypothetical protein
MQHAANSATGMNNENSEYQGETRRRTMLLLVTEWHRKAPSVVVRIHVASPKVEAEEGQQNDLPSTTPQHVPGVPLNAASQLPPPQHVSHPVVSVEFEADDFC